MVTYGLDPRAASGDGGGARGTSRCNILQNTEVKNEGSQQRAVTADAIKEPEKTHGKSVNREEDEE